MPNALDTMLQRLRMLQAMGKGQPQSWSPPPTQPVMAGAPPVMPGQGPSRGGDINLPPESGIVDPRLPMSHLPPEVLRRLLMAQMKGGQ